MVVIPVADTTKVAFNLRLPKELVDEVDERAGKLGLSRNQWYENMTIWVLDHTETVKARSGTP